MQGWNAAGMQRSRSHLVKLNILAAALSALLASGSLEAAQLGSEPEPAAPGRQIPQPQQGGDIAKLMSSLEEEIAAGRLSAPTGDNAIETLQRILKLVPDATPSDLDAIDAMPSRFDQRASEARARGDTQAANRFSAFRDAFAPGGWARHTPASPSPAPVTPPVASPTPADLSGAVERLESKPETKDLGSLPGSPQPTVAAITPKSVQNPPEPPEPDHARTGGNPEPPNTANLAPGPDPAITVLLKRGEEKLAQGDISAARLLFQRAAQARSGAGAAGMARSYDPVFLTNLGASGIQADSELATEWYRKAIALGDDEAAVELRRLERWKSESAGNLKARPRARP
jgi:hypothetical protein